MALLVDFSKNVCKGQSLLGQLFEQTKKTLETTDQFISKYTLFTGFQQHMQSSLSATFPF